MKRVYEFNGQPVSRSTYFRRRVEYSNEDKIRYYKKKILSAKIELHQAQLRLIELLEEGQRLPDAPPIRRERGRPRKGL